MDSSSNLASIESWSFRSASFPDPWISDAFSRDTEALTRALQESLYSNTTTTTTNQTATGNFDNESSFQHVLKTEPVNTSPGSVSDANIYPKRRGGFIGNAGRVTKRKSRASKRATTTFIAADPSNFRQMVQQITGIQFGEMQMAVSSVLKPEPQRPGNGNGNRIQNYGLPTLDTSECWLGRVGVGVGPTGVPEGNGAVEELSGLDYGMFPTLESWQ